MASKPIVWEFTGKDLITYTGFLLTMAGGYFGIINKIETNQIKNEATQGMLSYRIGELEKGKDKVAYCEPKEAILPTSPRTKRNLLVTTFE